MTKITRFELLRRALIHRDQAFKRVPKIMQNYAKMHRKSPQNEHEKMWISVLQWPKTHAVARPAKMHQNAFIFVVPGVALLTPWMQKLLKIVDNSSQNDHKKCDSRSCNGQKRRSSNDLQKLSYILKLLSFWHARWPASQVTVKNALLFSRKRLRHDVFFDPFFLS